MDLNFDDVEGGEHGATLHDTLVNEDARTFAAASSISAHVRNSLPAIFNEKSVTSAGVAEPAVEKSGEEDFQAARAVVPGAVKECNRVQETLPALHLSANVPTEIGN